MLRSEGFQVCGQSFPKDDQGILKPLREYDPCELSCLASIQLCPGKSKQKMTDQGKGNTEKGIFQIHSIDFENWRKDPIQYMGWVPWDAESRPAC